VTGLLRFQNEDLVQARALIGQLAASLGSAINAQQSLGLNLQPPPGSVPSSPMFSIGVARVLSNMGNARDAGGAYIGSVSLSVTNPSQLRASEYTLEETTPGSGSWLLTLLTDGVQTAVVDGDTVDGVQINFGSPAPRPGDRFLLQPVSRAANGFAALLDDPLDIAAAAPLVATANPANTGTAAVASFSMVVGATSIAGATATISFTSNSGNYSWELRDGGGGLLSAGSATWTAGGSIPATGTDINGFSMRLSGVPRNGDVITVLPTPPGALAASNGNATALLALRDMGITGGRTPSESWSNALADIGVRVQSAASSATISQAVAGQAETLRAGKSGVNLDEEAARLIQYQQSYQAAAKVLQVAQTLFQQLIDVAGN
jgi:flagellar hook-associated protein 1 FlgK